MYYEKKIPVSHIQLILIFQPLSVYHWFSVFKELSGSERSSEMLSNAHDKCYVVPPGLTT